MCIYMLYHVYIIYTYITYTCCIIVDIILIPPLSSLLSPPNFMHCLLEKAKNQTTESIYCYPYVHGCGAMQWGMGGLSNSASLGKITFTSLGSHQLPIAPQLGVRLP